MIRPVVLACALLQCAALVSASPALARTEAGDLLWQDEFDLAGGDDLATAVAAANGRVVVVGSARNAAGNLDFVVRAIDAKSGSLLWQDQLDLTGGDDRATAVSMDAQRVVVAGRGADGEIGQLLLRSYRPKSGALEWEVRSPATLVTGLAMDDGRLVVVGSLDGASFIRAYTAKRGALLWEDNLIPGQHFTPALERKRVALQGRMAFLATTLRDPASGQFSRCLIRAYNVAKAVLVWESLSGEGSCRALAIATDDRRVFVAGQTGVAEDDFHIRTFDAETGAELWRRQTFFPSGRENAALAVDAERRTVFVGGWRFAAMGVDSDVFLVQGYDVHTGELRWQDTFQSSTRCLCRARDLLAHNGRVFAVGDDGSERRWLVRVYDATDGTVLWDDDVVFPGEPTPTENAVLGARAVVTDGGKVFVAGSGVNTSGDADFIVRVYDAK